MENEKPVTRLMGKNLAEIREKARIMRGAMQQAFDGSRDWGERLYYLANLYAICGMDHVPVLVISPEDLACSQLEGPIGPEDLSGEARKAWDYCEEQGLGQRLVPSAGGNAMEIIIPL